MKRKKRLLAIVLSVSMALGLAACGKGTSENPDSAGGETAGASNEGSYEQVVYTYATFNNIPAEEDLASVEEAINEITRKKISAEVTLKPISIADYSSKVSLALQGGEKIDIFQSLGDFNNCVATDMSYDLTDLLDSCAAEAKELIGEEWLAACSSDGKIYGIPTYKPVALTPMVIYRTDIAEELKIDMSTVNSPEDLTPILKQVKEAYPDMIPLSPVQAGSIGLDSCFNKVDYLTDSYYTPIGVLMNGELTVTDLYATDEFKDLSGLARNWYNEGLIMKDAATTTSSAAECMSSGNYFGYIAAYSYPEEDTATSLAAQSGGYDIGAKMIGGAYLSTSDINTISWMVASTTDVPEVALKFLNLTFTDEEIVNLLINGLEGRDYVKNDDGTVSYPEGEDASTVPYTAQLSCGTLGNYFIMYPIAGTNPDSLEWCLEQNKTTETSPAMGFTFDSGSLKTQYTAVNNVISQYLPGLLCGSLEPDTEIDKFVQALNNAGYQDILSAKQEQLDVWLSEQ